MSTVVKRQIRATPQRTADEVWQVIVDLIAADKSSPARSELAAVAGIVGQVIASEATESSPIVVFGSGPRLRVYCLYNEAAITGDDTNEGPLAFNATEEDWKISVPALAEDLEWVRTELRKRSKRILAREPGDLVEEDDKSVTAQSARIAVDVASFLKP